jgi:hypothetical protein
VLRTDLDERRAAALLLRLERIRLAVGAALFPDAPEVPGRVEVIAFRTEREFRFFAPRTQAGYYLRYAGGPPRIVLGGELLPWQDALLAHELAHHYLAGSFARLPRWVAEGLAVYVESVKLAADGRLAVGEPPLARLARALENPVPVREVLTWSGDPARPALHLYASSWLLVHYLHHRRPAAFAGFQARLARGEPPDAAFAAAFPDLAPESAHPALELDLAEYARTAVRGFRTVLEVPGAVGYFERPVPVAEVHALRLALWAHGPEKGTAALRAEVAAILREDAAHPIGLEVRAALERQDPLPAARTAVRAHPDDPRAWTFLAGALPEAAAEEREAAYRRAAELAPDNPAALHNLARELLAQGRSGEALPAARRAAGLAPWSPPLLDGYARVLSDLGRCEEAQAVQRRALEVLPENAGAAAREEIAGRLAAYGEQCGGGAGAEGGRR